MIQDTVQKAFREFLRNKQSPVRPNVAKNSFLSTWDVSRNSHVDTSTDHLQKVISNSSLRRSREFRNLKANGELQAKPYSIHGSAKRVGVKSPYQELN